MRKYLIIIPLLILLPLIVRAETITVTYDSCIDGDTAHFIYQDKNLKTRFIAINAPEIEHEDKKADFKGEEAKEFICNILSNASKIELEYDNNSAKEDKYGRTLAWIWVDDKLLQESIIEKGLAKVDFIYDEYLYVPYLCQVEKKSFQAKVGIWEKEEKLGYCSKVEDTNITLEELKKEKLEDIDIKVNKKDIIILAIFAIFIIFITLITLYIIRRS